MVSSCPTCSFEKTSFPLFSAGTLGVQPRSDPLSWCQTFQLNTKEKCLLHSLFSLIHCFVFCLCYSSRVADRLWLLPACWVLCILQRSSTAWDFQELRRGLCLQITISPLNAVVSSPYPATRKHKKFCYILVNSDLCKDSWSFECSCILTNSSPFMSFSSLLTKMLII